MPAKVSIITLSHNRPAYLSEAVKSIQNQTLTNWEHIIIDDFSTDPGIAKVLNDLIGKPKMRIFRTAFDMDNIALLWNRGLEASSGEYIALLDDDNRKKPTFCQEMSDYLDQHPKIDAVACYNQNITPNGKLLPGIIEITKEVNIPGRILKGNCIDSGNLMFRRSVIEKIGWFDERLRTEEDWDFIVRLFYNSGGLEILPKALSEYRKHGENRIGRSVELGWVNTHQFIIDKNTRIAKRKLNVTLMHQELRKIVLSQNNVLCGIDNAMKKIPWINYTKISENNVARIKTRQDIILVFMPFIQDESNVMIARAKADFLVSYHCEDPHGISENMVRVRHMNYVFTNDLSTQREYEIAIGNGYCGFCPSISVDDSTLQFRKGDVPKKYDVLFYGYKYDSREKLIQELADIIPKERLTVAGGNWQGNQITGVNYIPEMNEQDSIRTMEEAKIVILHNRKKTDLGGNDGSWPMHSLTRGYFECASGSVIMIDNDRPHHSFKDEVVFYSDVKDLASKIDRYLKDEKLRKAIGSKAKQRALTDFTYSKRIPELLNAVRSMRFSYQVK